MVPVNPQLLFILEFKIADGALFISLFKLFKLYMVKPSLVKLYALHLGTLRPS